uniref:Uncharacterized protein n=1 Tax=Macrostomum lignano TaxID=282301 RepID=A0A1I8H222_9PLAT
MSCRFALVVLVALGLLAVAAQEALALPEDRKFGIFIHPAPAWAYAKYRRNSPPIPAGISANWKSQELRQAMKRSKLCRNFFMHPASCYGTPAENAWRG